MTRFLGIADRPRRVAATTVVAATLLLAGCTADEQTSPAEYTALLDYAGAQAEYRDAASRLAAPTGYEFPDTFDAAEDELYQVGYGEARAVTFWNCAWGEEWLRLRTDDPAAAAVALEAYGSVASTEVFQTTWDPVSIQQPFRESIERAELGDPAMVQADIQANCP